MRGDCGSLAAVCGRVAWGCLWLPRRPRLPEDVKVNGGLWETARRGAVAASGRRTDVGGVLLRHHYVAIHPTSSCGRCDCCGWCPFVGDGHLVPRWGRGWRWSLRAAAPSVRAYVFPYSWCSVVLLCCIGVVSSFCVRVPCPFAGRRSYCECLLILIVWAIAVVLYF